jgi:hypothetical protein
MMSHRNVSSLVNSNSNGQATSSELEYASEASVIVFPSFTFDDAASLLIASKEKKVKVTWNGFESLDCHVSKRGVLASVQRSTR